MASSISLIVGLGNPGREYEQTRHNAGFFFVDEVARRHGGSLKPEKKFFGEVGKVSVGGQDIWLLKPDTFMNRSGQAVVALANFYKISPEAILVAHDELDLEPGVLRLKQGGGHGGHNGLRDIIAKTGSKEFWRLRLGIGHPGHSSQVTGFVLGKPSSDERIELDRAIDRALDELPDIIAGEQQKAMNRLHSK